VYVGVDDYPSAILNHDPRTTFAVLRATPGRARRSCMLKEPARRIGDNLLRRRLPILIVAEEASGADIGLSCSA